VTTVVPPLSAIWLRDEAVFPHRMQLARDGADVAKLYIAPPSLAVNVQLVKVGEDEEELHIPPP
jgi:hypothetical protein